MDAVGAILHGESEITWGENLLSSVTRNSLSGPTNPKQLAYRCKYWAVFIAEVILGVYA